MAFAASKTYPNQDNNNWNKTNKIKEAAITII